MAVSQDETHVLLTEQYLTWSVSHMCDVVVHILHNMKNKYEDGEFGHRHNWGR